jgi:hypothetical protein
MTPLKTNLALLTTGMATLVLGVGVAAAHTTSFNSTVTIDQSEFVFFGTVSSPRPGCVPNRLVKLFRRNPDTLVGSDTTGQDGNWEVAAFPENAFYYAKVTRKNIGPSGHRHICRADASPDLQGDPP